METLCVTFVLCSSSVFLFQNVREPSSDTQLCSPPASIPKSGSSGMIQYLQSWFPGWGGWYGDSADPDRPEELLTSPSSWDILGEKICASLPVLAKCVHSYLHPQILLSFCNENIVPHSQTISEVLLTVSKFLRRFWHSFSYGVRTLKSCCKSDF